MGWRFSSDSFFDGKSRIVLKGAKIIPRMVDKPLRIWYDRNVRMVDSAKERALPDFEFPNQKEIKKSFCNKEKLLC